MKTYFQTLWQNPAACRKFFAALIGVLLLMATQGLFPDLAWVNWAVGLLTVLATYATRNAPMEGGIDNG